MKKGTMKIVLLLMSIAFYIYTVIMGISGAINGVNPYGSTYYGMDAFKQVFTDYTVQAVLSGKLLGYWFMFSTLYIVYFVASYKKEPRENELKIKLQGKEEIKTEESTTGESVKKVFFILSILVLGTFFLSAINAAVNGFNAGWFGTVDMVYGFEAFYEFIFMYGLLYTVIPILPCSILYIVTYLVKNKKAKKEKYK